MKILLRAKTWPVVFSICCVQMLMGQYCPNPDSVTITTQFTKTYDVHVRARGKGPSDVTLTADSCYAVSFSGFTDTTETAELVKLDAAGNVLWRRTTHAATYCYGNMVAATPDSGIVTLTGYEKDTFPDGYLYRPLVTKYDRLGNIQWRKIFENDTLDVLVKDIEVAGNNIFVHYSGIRLLPGGVQEVDYFIAKMDLTGNAIWHKFYAYGGRGNGEFCVTPQKEMYVTAPMDNEVLSVSRIDSNGNLVWSRHYTGISESAIAYSLLGDSTGVTIAGNATAYSIPVPSSDVLVMRLDKNGDVVWAKGYDSNAFESGYELHSTKTGYVITITRGSFPANTGALLSIDSNGNFIWGKTYHSSLGLYPNHSLQLKDGYLIFGKKINFGTSNLQPMLLLRTDTIGVAACRWECVNFTSVNYNNITWVDTGYSGNLQNFTNFTRADEANPLNQTDDCTLLLIEASATDAACLNEGTAKVEIIDGAGPFTYLWSNGLTTPEIDNLPGGTYTVTVTGALGSTAVDTAVVVQQNSLALSMPDSVMTCVTPTASLAVEVIFGTGPYTYLWSNGATADSIGNLTSGFYAVTVTGAGGCQGIATANVHLDAFTTAAGVDQNVRCGLPNGRISASPTGPFAGLRYVWSTGDSTRIINGKPIGSYSVTVTNLNGCTASATAVLDSSSTPVITLSTTHTTCGYNNGSITVNVPTGPAFGYTWSPGPGSGRIRNNLVAGNYAVIVRHISAGCSDTLSTVVDSSQGFSLTTTVTPTTCGESNGRASASPSPEMAPYTYQWSMGGSDSSISNLWSSVYIVTVTSSTGCTSTASVNVAASAAVQPLLNISNTTCGNNNGAVTANVLTGVGPFTFVWSQGDTTQTITGLTPTYYEVTVTGAGNCSASAGGYVTISDTMKLLASSLPTTCGQNNGFTVVNVTGGAYPFSVQWSNGDTNQVIFNAAAGNYDVSVTDANGCTSEASVTVNVSSPITLSMSAVNTTCGLNNGSASVAITAGTGPYTYRWTNNLGLTSSISNLPAGNYTVTVTGQANCTGTASVAVGSSQALTVSTSTVNTTCGNANGSVSVNVLTGTSPYIYQWNSGAGNATLPNLSAGNYSVTVSDSTLCTATASRTINASTALAFTLSPSDATCGANNGQVTASITSGTAPYRYLWSNADTTAGISALATGNYTLTLTDAATCTASASATVGFLPGLLLSTSVHDATCGNNNGSARVSISAGTGPYTFNWSNSNPTDSVSGLAPGSYSVTVTGAASCSATAGITINASAGLVLSSSTTATTCGNANGAASINVTSGTGPFIYGWSNSTGLAAITNVTSGTYTVTVTGAGACSATSSINIGASVALSATTTITGTTCGLANGAAAVNISTGTTPYNYTWSNGEANAGIQNMAANIYTVSISDAAGCADTLTADIDSSVALVVTTTSTSTSCGAVNGVAQVDITSGILPYTYLWNTSDNAAQLTGILSGTYTVTVNDGAGCSVSAAATVGASGGLVLSNSVTNASCGNSNGAVTINIVAGIGPYLYNWSNGESTAGIANLDSGSYMVTVTGNGGCSATDTITISRIPGVTLNTLFTGSGCTNNGSAGVQVSTGQGPFTYQWTNGGSNNSISNIAPGIYTVTATGAGNCSATASINVPLLDSLVIGLTITNTSCGANNGMVLTNIITGTAPVTYLWSNDSTGAYTGNLAASNYAVTASDADGCIATATASVSASVAITLTTTTAATLCNENNGSATVSVAGAITPYTLVWSNGDTADSATDLPAGNVTIDVNDARGCQASATANVGASVALNVAVQPAPTNCGFHNGSASAVIASGMGPYTYVWDNSGNDSMITNLAPGTYKVTVTDANGCIAAAAGMVSPSDSNTVEVTADKTLMCPGDSALICAPAGFVSYLWNTGESTRCINGVLAGYYAVTVTDIAGCPATNRIAITVRVLPPVSVTVAGDTLTSYNALTYQWYLNGQPINGATSNVYVAKVSGSYQVQITDTTGCNISSTPVSVIITGVQKLSGDGAVKVAPNPLGEGSWRLSVTEDLIGAEVQLFDEQGRVVYQSIVTAPQSEIAVHIAQGVYIMRIQAAKGNYAIRLVKL